MPSQAQIPNQQRETPSQRARVITGAQGWERRSRPTFVASDRRARVGLKTAEGLGEAKKAKKKYDDDEIRTHAILLGFNP